MSVTDEIKDRIDIVEIISQQVSLKKSGKTFKGNCPFHGEKTPSFYVYPDNWSYHCFGCGAHGSGFDFVMATQKMNFGEAVRHLAQKAGVTLTDRQTDSTQDKERQRLREILESAVQYFQNLLLSSPAGQVARAYLEKRGLNRETIEGFQLGYSLNGWEAIEKYLASKGYSQEELVAAGLLVKREEGTAFDRFRNRLMFPIRDASGGMSGFGARALDDSQPKYLNSPETLLFDKGAILFAVDKAAIAIRSRDLAVVVEGYMDAIMAHQYGYKNVVASMGTALSEKQIRVLKRLSKNLALALDPDAAGDKATLRGLEVAKESFDQKVIAIPSWQGYVRYEHRLDANIKVVTLPRGKDPDEIIRENPASWLSLVDSAQPTIDFLFSTVTASSDLTDPKSKSQVVEQLLPVIGEISDSVIRAHYLQRLARLVNVDERTLLTSVPKATRSKEGNRPKAGASASTASAVVPVADPVAASPSRDRVEAYCLALLLQHPECQSEAAAIDSACFLNSDYRCILEAWRTTTDLQDLVERLDGRIREELVYLAGLSLLPMDGEMRREELASIARMLEERHLRRMVKENANHLRDAQAASDGEQVGELQQRGVELASRLSRLERARKAL